MDIYDAMSTQRAVRKLRPDPIPDDVLERVLKAATWAPTGGNLQPWRIVVVDDAQQKERLRDLYAPQWKNFALIYRRRFAHLESEERDAAERTLAAGDYLAENMGRAPVVLVFCFNPDWMAITDAEQNRVSVVGGASIYPAVQNTLLACRCEGLGCVLTTLHCQREPEVRETLALPEGWYIAATVPVGYPVARGHGPISRKSVAELTFRNRWPESASD